MVICMYMMYKYIISYYYQYSVIYYVAAKSYLMYALLQDQQSTRPSYLLTYLLMYTSYILYYYIRDACVFVVLHTYNNRYRNNIQ